MTNHNLLFFDIETVPDNELDISLGIPAKIGNLKDENKILAKQKEWIDGGQVKAHSVSPYHNKIVALEMYVQDKANNNFVGVWMGGKTDEERLLHTFHYNASFADYIIGFNILNFDLPTIMFRSAMLGVKPHPLPLRRYSNKPVCDLMQVLAHWDSRNWKSLAWMGKRFGLKTQKDGEGSDVYKWYKEGNIDKIREHARADVELTKELFTKIQPVYLPEILTFE